MSDTQGHAGGGADALYPDLATPLDYAEVCRALEKMHSHAKSLESEVSRLRAELGEAKKVVESLVGAICLQLDRERDLAHCPAKSMRAIVRDSLSKSEKFYDWDKSHLIECIDYLNENGDTRPASPAERAKNDQQKE